MNIKHILPTLGLLIASGAHAQKASLVSYDDYENLVKEVKTHRASHLLPLDQFLKKAKEPNTIILDTRSREMYDLKHVKGAIHLNFSDFTQENLDRIAVRYGGANVQIMIYCNNNFEDRRMASLQDLAFITKSARPRIPAGQTTKIKPVIQVVTLALNIPTYINLYGYGYQNVYELSELVDVNDPRIQFEGTASQKPVITSLQKMIAQ